MAYGRFYRAICKGRCRYRKAIQMDAQSWEITTRTGLKLHVRTAGARDEAVLDQLFHQVRNDDLHFRFLSGQKAVRPEQIHAMIDVDHRTTETYIGFIAGSKLAVTTAMLACDRHGRRGEVAVSVRADYRDCGIGWEMLSFVAKQAERSGLAAIESIESRDNHDAIELERNMGFVVRSYPDDPTLVLVTKQLGNQAAL
ncbi:GNAT family N-acetyltransferase [Mesorhizobium sp. B2-4-14]|uniref:GNAT family N-acetyltransferase n=1 Tax=Mesorhizobium sp. B2-4-14 TaxID=2589935 RepID=UPI00112EF7EA|nr:GNAT family N-acetyltransferase [Mesorhizobium sp. B2-4-14]TPL09619.1 GNAT family N-acetyltransferase [Mesorhizobium sp. B2-4-14]